MSNNSSTAVIHENIAFLLLSKIKRYSYVEITLMSVAWWTSSKKVWWLFVWVSWHLKDGAERCLPEWNPGTGQLSANQKAACLEQSQSVWGRLPWLDDYRVSRCSLHQARGHNLRQKPLFTRFNLMLKCVSVTLDSLLDISLNLRDKAT